MSTSVETQVRSPRRGITDSWLFPAMLFVAVAVVLSVVVQTSHTHLSPEKPKQGPDISDAEFYGGWMQFDSGWYVYLAEHGYDEPQVAAFHAGDQSAVAYFPGYPLTARQMARVTGDDYVLAAELTTIACGFAVFLLFWTWCRRRFSPAASRTAVL